MKLKAFFLIMATLLFLGSSTYTVQAQGTLAETINYIASNVNWNDGSFRVVHTGQIFGKLSGYGTAVASGVDSVRLLRLAEIDGYNLDKTSVLGSQTMVGSLPVTWTGNNFLIYHRFYEHAYRWSQGTSYQSKWDKSAALSQMYSYLPTPDRVQLAYPADVSGNYHRYYDDSAETIQFLIGVGDLTKAQEIWNWIQTFYWNGQFYGYNGKGGIECEAGPFAFVIGQLYVLSNKQLPNFDRVTMDLEYKFLANGWSSPLWTSYVCSHAGDNRLRLQNTEVAFAALQAYYSRMSGSNKASFVNMLTGSPKAWQGLLQSELYSAPKFRLLTNDSPGGAQLTNEFTTIGLKTLFLQGIIPDTGSLAIPMMDECYEDTESIMPATHFRFDYAGKTIRIPVNAGKLKFQFGSGIADYTFPSTGIYEVHFSNDWNTITSANMVSGLSNSFSYLDVQAGPLPSPSPTPSPSPSPSPGPSPSPSPPPVVFPWDPFLKWLQQYVDVRLLFAVGLTTVIAAVSIFSYQRSKRKKPATGKRGRRITVHIDDED